MIIDLKILESDSQIRQAILESIKSHVDQALNKAIGPITSEIKSVVSIALKTEPEYQSLIAGTLRVEFGIDNVGSVDLVIEQMINTLHVTKNPISITNVGLNGGFVLTMIKSDDINGIINSESASVITEKGTKLPWLEWLLFHSNKPIIRNYEVKIGPNPNSRTGMGIMVESNKNWRVPPEFAGSQQNNWTTRAISRVEYQLPKIFENNILKYI